METTRPSIIICSVAAIQGFVTFDNQKLGSFCRTIYDRQVIHPIVSRDSEGVASTVIADGQCILSEQGYLSSGQQMTCSKEVPSGDDSPSMWPGSLEMNLRPSYRDTSKDLSEAAAAAFVGNGDRSSQRLARPEMPKSASDDGLKVNVFIDCLDWNYIRSLRSAPAAGPRTCCCCSTFISATNLGYIKSPINF